VDRTCLSPSRQNITKNATEWRDRIPNEDIIKVRFSSLFGAAYSNTTTAGQLLKVL
jgi:hypothetical protein